MVKLKKNSQGIFKEYNPHIGYIGQSKITVPNYLYATNQKPTQNPTVSYSHCQELVKILESRSVFEQYNRAQSLTLVMRNNGFSFQKWTGSGYKEFSVPCTPLSLPLPYSMFNKLQKAAQVLCASLRFVMQDIYGEDSPSQSSFIKNLPYNIRGTFLNTILASPQYFSALHNPVMKDYPFFDVVGLDLVLTSDLLLAKSSVSDALPFSLLEINAGSPSGAANNLQILEAMHKIDPEMMSKLGQILPNNHTQIMLDTYQSLGHYWTNASQGVSIVLSPGGGNGASPEIHNLAQRSGLIYCEAESLFCDDDGYIKMRTVDGTNPQVLSIYSRVNADSVLFDSKKGILLRDPESGKPIFMTDPCLNNNTRKKNSPFLDLPLNSTYEIPNIIAAIHQRKIFLGGLNRLLDDKSLLDILCKYAPKFYSQKLATIGLNIEEIEIISPPASISNSPGKIKKIISAPKEWVIKSPNLSGGKGIHILRALNTRSRKKIVTKIKKNPTHFVVQKLVSIGRIPSPIKHKNIFKYANLAADFRMWVFFGAGDEHNKPILTRNALVRTAPTEKGPLSGFVNTSMGGGYAGMVVVDDMNTNMVPENKTNPFYAPISLRAGSQLIQIARIAYRFKNLLYTETDAFYIHFLISVCPEMADFLQEIPVAV